MRKSGEEGRHRNQLNTPFSQDQGLTLKNVCETALSKVPRMYRSRGPLKAKPGMRTFWRELCQDRLSKSHYKFMIDHYIMIKSGFAICKVFALFHMLATYSVDQSQNCVDVSLIAETDGCAGRASLSIP